MNADEIRGYLLQSRPETLRFFPHAVASELSDLAAILLYDLDRRISRQRKKNIEDGRVWTFDAMRVFAGNHPYAGEGGIRKAFLALENAGYVQIEKTGKYNGKRYDKKWWYHVTEKGIAAARTRRIRFDLNVAAALDIPKAVLLQNVRHQLSTSETGIVELDANTLNVPYGPRTVGRHLQILVADEILEQVPSERWRFRVKQVDWRAKNQPLSVDPAALLPKLGADQVGLLVGHSGTGKTSYSSFVTVQNALHGRNVLYVTLEEPMGSIVQRMYAQETGAPYTLLHRADARAERTVKAWLDENGVRKEALNEHLRFADLSGLHPQPHEVVDAIYTVEKTGFKPDLVLIDQLEFITVETEEEETAAAAETEMLHAQSLGTAIPAAIAVRACFAGLPWQTWVLHQVMGECESVFTEKDVAGGVDVTKRFDRVIGLGRATKTAQELRIFSLTSGVEFEQTVETDFAHMRFLPKETSRAGQKL